MVAFQFWICCVWIQDKNWFICRITNNHFWLKMHNSFGNRVIGCHKLPFLFCRGYLTSMLNKFDVLSIQLCIWPPLLGRLLRCQKLTNWRYLWFPSFFLLYWCLMKRYIFRNRLLRFIARSFNWLYSFGLKTWLFLWLNHLMNRLLWCF